MERKFAEAAAAYEKAAEVDRNSYGAMCMLWDCRKTLGDEEEANPCYRRERARIFAEFKSGRSASPAAWARRQRSQRPHRPLFTCERRKLPVRFSAPSGRSRDWRRMSPSDA
jgi:hypothetical protein